MAKPRTDVTHLHIAGCLLGILSERFVAGLSCCISCRVLQVGACSPFDACYWVGRPFSKRWHSDSPPSLTTTDVTVASEKSSEMSGAGDHECESMNVRSCADCPADIRAKNLKGTRSVSGIFGGSIDGSRASKVSPLHLRLPSCRPRRQLLPCHLPDRRSWMPSPEHERYHCVRTGPIT